MEWINGLIELFRSIFEKKRQSRDDNHKKRMEYIQSAASIAFDEHKAIEMAKRCKAHDLSAIEIASELHNAVFMYLINASTPKLFCTNSLTLKEQLIDFSNYLKQASAEEDSTRKFMLAALLEAYRDLQTNFQYALYDEIYPPRKGKKQPMAWRTFSAIAEKIK